MKLKHEVLRSPDSAATRAVVLLHGILGSGSNLRGLARAFLNSPEGAGCVAVLIDLRAHGGSLDAPDTPDSVRHAAADVVETLRSLPVEPWAVVGHSFGGKVALALEGLPLAHVMTLDSGPGARPDARGSERTFQVIDTVRRLADAAWPTRDDFIDALVHAGQTRPLSQWLAMNLERTDRGFRFKLDMARIDALLSDYLQLDLWPVVERAAHEPGPGARYHLVIALDSRVYEHDDRVRAQGLESGTVSGAPGVTVDLLDGSHWIHVDNPTGVVEVMRARLR